MLDYVIASFSVKTCLCMFYILLQCRPGSPPTLLSITNPFGEPGNEASDPQCTVLHDVHQLNSIKFNALSISISWNTQLCFFCFFW